MNFDNYSVTFPGTAAAVAPQMRISTLVSDDDGNLVADLTGDNALIFPACLAGFTEDQVEQILQPTVAPIIYAKLGV